MKRMIILIILTAVITTFITGCFGSASGSVTGPDEIESESETVDGAVPFGQWGDVEKHASGKYNPCKVRIVKVIRDKAEVQSRIDQYNEKSDSYHMIEPLTDKDKDLTEYIVIEYEILYPDDFPTINYGNHGIAFPHIGFDGRTNDGGGFIASDGTYYVGMGMSLELVKLKDTEFPLPGDTFTGAILLQMLKGYDKFHLEYMYKIGDSEDYIKALFAIK